MRHLALAAATLALALPAAALEAPLKIVDYDIQVSLDPETKLVEGSETLKWTNPSDVPVGELRFHLYWNAFRNDRSTFFKESGGQLRGDKADTEKGWGYTDVTSVKWDGFELVKAARFESPDDGNPDDRTVLVVPLHRPVAPGETAARPLASNAIGRSEADLLAGFHKVAIRLYRQPEHGAFDRRHIGAQKWALAWTGLWCFPYPYAQISIIDTPEDGMGATGMEYETIYTKFSFTWRARWPFNRIYIPETVTIHEFTHGYWMGLVASNEFEESWMDEGINTFTEIVMVDRKYGSHHHNGFER